MTTYVWVYKIGKHQHAHIVRGRNESDAQSRCLNEILHADAFLIKVDNQLKPVENPSEAQLAWNQGKHQLIELTDPDVARLPIAGTFQ